MISHKHEIASLVLFFGIIGILAVWLGIQVYRLFVWLFGGG